MNGEDKTNRMLDIFFRALKGEALSIRELADEFHTSSRSISRDISSMNIYLAEHRDTVGNAELIYDAKPKKYLLHMDDFLSGKEMLLILKMLLACRTLSKPELTTLIKKLESHATPKDKKKLKKIIGKEFCNYTEIQHDCNSTLNNLWEITNYIEKKQFISITYIKMNREIVEHRIMPLSLIFSEYYFYLIACETDNNEVSVPKYFRIDRIVNVVAHRDYFHLSPSQEYDESLLRKRSQFMWPGPLRHIRFEFYGPSVQSILDRIPTAKIIKKIPSGYLIEAEVYGDGIKMFLLSQGAWIKVIAPAEFVAEMKDTIKKMQLLY